jgi:hypothetical protein
MKVPAVHSLSVAGRAPIVAVGLVTGPFASVMLSNSGPNAAPSLPNDCRGNRIFLTPRIAKNGPRTSSHCGPYGLSTASSTPCIVPADSPVLVFSTSTDAPSIQHTTASPAVEMRSPCTRRMSVRCHTVSPECVR